LLILDSNATLGVFMLTCPQRAHARMRTLADMTLTDISQPDYVRCSMPLSYLTPFEDARLGALELLAVAERRRVDFALLLEDDLRFNTYIGLSTMNWLSELGVKTAESFLGSLYRPSFTPRTRYHNIGGNFIRCDSRLFYLLSGPSSVPSEYNSVRTAR
jgi:hypothetical protein